jgi:hypothetical protein
MWEVPSNTITADDSIASPNPYVTNCWEIPVYGPRGTDYGLCRRKFSRPSCALRDGAAMASKKLCS